jgi:hypothetical protein
MTDDGVENIPEKWADEESLTRHTSIECTVGCACVNDNVSTLPTISEICIGLIFF